MKVVIVEDEFEASDNLRYLLGRIDPDIEVAQVLDCVRLAVPYFLEHRDMDLVFMDIHLADGLSFEIFDKVAVPCPVVFTTAYDQYALKAFKVNSIDYLLKPIDEDELSQALDQFRSQRTPTPIQGDQVSSLLQLLERGKPKYKSMFLVSKGDRLVPLKTGTIAYLLIDTGIVKGITFDNQSYPMDATLEELEEELDPNLFYRVNRQCIVHREAITNIKFYFNGKLIVKLRPESDERIVVSKAKAKEFKEWVGS